MRVLVVEDDEMIAEGLRFSLMSEDYEVLSAGTVQEAEKIWRSGMRPDFCLLDVMLPDGDGFSLCREIRRSSKVPVLFLTACDDEVSTVRALELGADDYITKPFSPSELTARVDAIYRRVCMSFIKDEQSPVIESGPFTLNLKSRTVTKNGKLIDLTQVEYQIMEYFLNNQNTALDRASILNHIWGDGYFGDDKIVDVNIRRIRMKIEEEPSKPHYITTIWGYGYKWNDK